MRITVDEHNVGNTVFLSIYLIMMQHIDHETIMTRMYDIRRHNIEIQTIHAPLTAKNYQSSQAFC